MCRRRQIIEFHLIESWLTGHVLLSQGVQFETLELLLPVKFAGRSECDKDDLSGFEKLRDDNHSCRHRGTDKTLLSV